MPKKTLTFSGSIFFTMHIVIYPVMALLCASCGKKDPPAPPPPVVEVMETKPTSVPINTEIMGQLDSPQNVEVRARVEGFVENIRFVEGTEVKQGDLLFELDNKPFLERLAAAHGGLAEAKAALNKYEKDVARLAPLAERNAIPRRDLDNALASVEVGKAGVETANARVESAQIDLGYCEIKAPISGLIGAKQVSIGELVGKGQPTLLATMSTLDPIWFYCNISEVEYLKAKEKSAGTGADISSLPVTLILADGSEHKSPGKFVFIDRAVDVKTGTLRMRAEFPNPDKLLRPGMFARVRVSLGLQDNAIVVPQRAIVDLQGRTFAWVVSPDGKATQRAVKLGETIASNVLVAEGLSTGEQIVVEGLQKVREGQAVRIAAEKP